MRATEDSSARWSRWCRWPLLLALMLLSEVSNAQPRDPEILVGQGIQLRQEGRDADALALFRQAAGIAPDSPRILGHLALALHATHQWLESERVMQNVIRAADDDWVVRHEAELTQSLEKVQDHLAWLEIDTPLPGKLWLDDTLIGEAPTRSPLRVVAKPCVLRLEIPNRLPIVRSVTIPARRHWQLYLIDTAAVSPAAPAPARAAKVSDARPSPPPPPPSRRNGLGLALLGFGSAGILAGVALGIDALVLRNERDKECAGKPECSRRGVELDGRGRQAATLAEISFVAGASTMGASAVLLW